MCFNWAAAAEDDEEEEVWCFLFVFSKIPYFACDFLDCGGLACILMRYEFH